MMDFVKKTFEKIDEYKKWNALSEAERVKYEELKKKNDSIEAGFAERENDLVEREKSINERERQLEASIDRTRLKLETSIEEINEQIRLGQIEDSNLSKSIEEKQKEIEGLKKNTDLFRNEKEKALRDLEGIKDKIASLKLKERLQADESRNLEKEFDKVSENLRKKQEEIKDIGKRQEDLKIYEKRIQRYYDEAGIKIKL